MHISDRQIIANSPDPDVRRLFRAYTVCNSPRTPINLDRQIRANSPDLDQTPHSTSAQGLHCLCHVQQSLDTPSGDKKGPKTCQVSSKANPASILYKSIAGRYRPVSYPDGPITARYRFIKNAGWELAGSTSSIRTDRPVQTV